MALLHQRCANVFAGDGEVNIHRAVSLQDPYIVHSTVYESMILYMTFKSYGKGLQQAVRGIGIIPERRHTAIASYINGIGYLKALDAGEKRLSLFRSWLSRNLPSQNF